MSRLRFAKGGKVYYSGKGSPASSEAEEEKESFMRGGKVHKRMRGGKAKHEMMDEDEYRRGGKVHKKKDGGAVEGFKAGGRLDRNPRLKGSGKAAHHEKPSGRVSTDKSTPPARKTAGSPFTRASQTQGRPGGDYGGKVQSEHDD